MIEILKHKMTPETILTAGFGLEREGLRVTAQGKLAVTPHPPIFGDKLKNLYITTDFSESQVELITPVFHSVDETYDFLEALTDIVINEMKDKEELIWPYSMPCDLPEDKDIPIAVYEGESGRKPREYREKLMAKYGGKRQLISGIHYNFSFGDDFVETLWKESGTKSTLKEYKDKIYLKVLRNFLRYRWLIIYLLGCTPGLHESYIQKCLDCMEASGAGTFLSQKGISARNGSCSGYKNEIDLFPDYSSVNAYVSSVNEFISRGDISEAKELYAQIRLKPKDNNNVLESLEKDGIEYLEIRTIDLNVFDKCGIAKIDLEFLNMFMLFLLLEGEEFFDTWQQEALINELTVAENGLDSDLELLDHRHWTLKSAWAEDILEKIAEVNEYLDLKQDRCIEAMLDRVRKPEKTYAYRLKKQMLEKGYIKANLALSNKYKSDSEKEHYRLKGFENWEMSTQILIKEAITRGIKVIPMDESDNIIALEKSGHRREYVKQATKTSADTYITPLLMENKVVTKKILKENGIPVPNGEEYFSFEEACRKLPRYVGKKVVIKPKSTNFGLGICIYDRGGTIEELLEGARIAFEHDNTILIEEYIKGLEYRFLTMGDEVVAVLHRRPANVVGDGVRTIQELIDKKNEHPYRGDGHTSPLKKIELDDQSQMFLKKQGISIATVPKSGEMIYLRGNSNISTGGDSIDFTEKMHPNFSSIALEAVKAFDAKFCGVDIIIEDFNNPESAYGIIELNFNPMIVMHAYPYQGKERRLGYNILKTIGLAE